MLKSKVNFLNQFVGIPSLVEYIVWNFTKLNALNAGCGTVFYEKWHKSYSSWRVEKKKRVINISIKENIRGQLTQVNEKFLLIINPLLPSAHKILRIAKISILKLEGIINKIPMSVVTMSR